MDLICVWAAMTVALPLQTPVSQEVRLFLLPKELEFVRSTARSALVHPVTLSIGSKEVEFSGTTLSLQVKSKLSVQQIARRAKQSWHPDKGWTLSFPEARNYSLFAVKRDKAGNAVYVVRTRDEMPASIIVYALRQRAQ